MNIDISTKDEFTIAAINGRIDTVSAGDFESKITGIIDGGTNKIILDCGELKYISSSGLRVFLVVQKRLLASGGKLRICNLQPDIKEIFDISGFSNIFDIY